MLIIIMLWTEHMWIEYHSQTTFKDGRIFSSTKIRVYLFYNLVPFSSHTWVILYHSGSLILFTKLGIIRETCGTKSDCSFLDVHFVGRVSGIFKNQNKK